MINSIYDIFPEWKTDYLPYRENIYAVRDAVVRGSIRFKWKSEITTSTNTVGVEITPLETSDFLKAIDTKLTAREHLISPIAMYHYERYSKAHSYLVRRYRLWAQYMDTLLNYVLEPVAERYTYQPQTQSMLKNMEHDMLDACISLDPDCKIVKQSFLFFFDGKPSCIIDEELVRACERSFKTHDSNECKEVARKMYNRCGEEGAYALWLSK